jgi:outer membrane autotransporter protein
LALVPQTAIAADECGAPSGTPPAVTCTGSFPTGITYSVAAPGLALTAQAVTVGGTGGIILNGAGATMGASSIVTTGTNTIDVNGPGNTFGIAILNRSGATFAGNLSVNSNAIINVQSTGGDTRGIFIDDLTPNSTADLSITYGGPSINVQAPQAPFDATGIHVRSIGSAGNLSIDAQGNITGGTATAGNTGFVGIFAQANFNGTGTGNATVNYHSGTVNITGASTNGIVARNDGTGSAVVTTDAGTAVIVSGGDGATPGSAISARSFRGLASDGASVVATIGSTIDHFGPPGGAFRSAIRADSGMALAGNLIAAQITVTYTGGGIRTFGDNGLGIFAESRNGTVLVNSQGPITTNGANSFGIRADSGNLATLFSAPSPGDAFGPVAAAGISGLVAVNATAPIVTFGSESHGIWASSATAAVAVTASNVTTSGEFSAGIRANAASTTVAVAAGGSVMGGWQPGVTDLGPTLGLPSAGVILSSTSGSAVLTNNGTLGALSDRAVFGDPTIINNGTMTGFVQLTGINDYTNNGTFDFRHFADTNGDGVRDTLRVAVSDLGSGPSTFTNNGRLALLGGPGATTLDSSGEYLPFGLAVNSMALGGPVQGQILGATTFTNSGVIDLRANDVAGDVLVISGGHTPGVSGGGTFISNGGSLLINTVLNQGDAASQSDILVVDGTQVGPGGATSVFVQNAGGAGAETVSNGIPVVQVLDPTRSAGGAFTLPGEVRGGAFDYRLFQGGLNGSNPGDWFLRSTFIVPPGPPEPPEPPFPPEPPPTPLPPGVHPIIGPELATYGVVQPIARQMGLTTLGTLHERVGDAAADAACLNAASTRGWEAAYGAFTKAPPAPEICRQQAVWGRLFGQQINNHYLAFADPRASGQVAGIQSGADLWRGSLIPGHSDSAGLYFAYGNGNARVDGLVTNAAATAYVLQRTGSLNLNAYSLGGYWTHYGPTGWYIDAVLQGSFYKGNAATEFANLPISGTGFTSSLEAGYPIPLPWFGPGFILEPEGQIIWQRVSFRDDDDGLGPVGLGKTSGASGRLGLRGKWTINDPAGRVWQPYVLANVWRDWGGGATTMFADDPVPLLAQATRLEFAGGLSAKLLPGLSLYAQAGYQFAVDGTDGGGRDGVKGNFGVRYSW